MSALMRSTIMMLEWGTKIRYTMMEACLRDCSRMVRNTVLEGSLVRTVRSFKASLLMARPMVLESWWIKMATSTMVSGLRTRWTVKALKPGKMVPHIMDNTSMDWRMVMVFTIGQMVALTTVSGKTTWWLVKELTLGPMETLTLACGTPITCMVTALTLTQTAENTLAHMPMIRKRDKVPSTGLMVGSTMVLGKTVNNKVKVLTHMQMVK